MASNSYALEQNDVHDNNSNKPDSKEEKAKKQPYSNTFAFFCGVGAGASAYGITAWANPALTGSFTFAIANLVSSIAPSAVALGLGSVLPYLLAALLVGLLAVAINSYINREPSTDSPTINP